MAKCSNISLWNSSVSLTFLFPFHFGLFTNNHLLSGIFDRRQLKKKKKNRIEAATEMNISRWKSTELLCDDGIIY